MSSSTCKLEKAAKQWWASDLCLF